MKTLIGLSVASVLLGACLCELYHRERGNDIKVFTPFAEYRFHKDSLESEGFEYGVHYTEIAPTMEGAIEVLTHRDYLLWEAFPFGSNPDYRVIGLEDFGDQEYYPVQKFIGSHFIGDSIYNEWHTIGFLIWDDEFSSYIYFDECEL